MMQTDLDFDSIAKAGSMLGSGAVIVMDETTCMVRALERLSYFYFEESCGQCTPCREGTGWMYRVVHRIEHGKGRQEDLDLLDNVADNIAGRTICALGDAAAGPVKSFVKHFRDEFQYHIDHKRCMVSVPGGYFTAAALSRRDRRPENNMPRVEIDGRQIEVQRRHRDGRGQRARASPFRTFCYHKKLSIAANCRMCLVQVRRPSPCRPAPRRWPRA